MTAAERLYGVPDAEHLHFDIATAYELQVEPGLDVHDRCPAVIEEFTVHPPERHLPTADRILEWIIEQTCEDGDVSEEYAERLADIDAIGVVEHFRSSLASLVTYRMADKRVAEHQITWDELGEPLVDGEPMYRRSGADA